MTVSASVEVKNKLGIHARPAMMLFELVQGFDAHVLLRNEEGVAWRECPESLRYTADAETWAAIPRNSWTYWKVRALDGAGNTVAESEVQEMKVNRSILPISCVRTKEQTDTTTCESLKLHRAR